MFNKQQLENSVYELVIGFVNDYFKEPRTTSETVQALRQLLQALHFVIEEEVVQIMCGTLMIKEVQQNKEGV